ncbi:TIGR02678 family protein [Dactylosporangium salmoneum]|uniref:TIGR02678 family protein n=1 Tax=Dactylosporangium salmoneum TaxID=53361 RepID=A0ABP5V4G9_9ACTN
MNTGTSADVRDGHRAFLGLLARPLVTAATDVRLYRLAARRRKQLSDTARRVGYRVQQVGQAVRLFRVPVSGAVTFPPRPADAPSRRLLSMVCRLAACCEDVAGTVTLQQLSDAVRDLGSALAVTLTEYDPEQQAQRRQLRDAARLLQHWGVLKLRTSDERLLEEWTENGSGPGAGYEVDRDALLLMTSPDVLALALSPEPSSPEQASATRTLRQLRALLETPAVLYADLDRADADALRQARGFRATDLAQMTGGTLEARVEGLVLVLTDDEHPDTVVDWPRARAADWVALLMADIAGRDGVRRADGTVYLTCEQVDDVAADLLRWRGDYMSKPQRSVPGVVRADAEHCLTELGLLRIGADRSWTLSPVAGRYRDPDVTLVDTNAKEDGSSG